ncbi:cysteine desulfurase-like protein [Gloeobacter morelensis]|uniref:Cysteine desulfurase-like protein n=1 Tax=Gloeobacter morelensis MG652769 TaxID=2781736 RepID=A0ABY3PJ56_9CYAN|nr:cysteine desulfurase-like protein [Gloeobacter morelensis]UFP93700.1 cysteine desulfurase-like protein [Gloeobacter morelensis MG652769]
MKDALDLDFVRRQFPALMGEWTFLDNAGGSQILGRVVERIADFLLTTNVQIGASYAISEAATARLDLARARMAAYLNAEYPEEIVHGSSTTQLLANLAAAMAPGLQPGDEIVVTDCDHESNIGPWVRLAQQRGLILKTWKINPETWTLEPEDLEMLLGDRTRLVCFTYASNVVGTIQPVAQIVRLAHRYGARVCIDAVAYAPHRAIDVGATGVDFLTFSTYKTYGPHAAVLYGKRDWLLELASLNHYFIGKEDIPYKLQPGNANFELAWGMSGLVDYCEQLAALHAQTPADTVHGRVEQAFEPIARHEEYLAERLLSYLTGKPNVRILGLPEADGRRRVPTVSFWIPGRHASEIPSQIDPLKIGIRWGDFYARRLIDNLGLTPAGGIVRVSMVHYNTPAEIDRLIAGLETVL